MSQIYTLLVKWNDKKKKVAQIWYREYWYQEDTNKFERLNYVPFSLRSNKYYVLIE